MDEGLYTAGYRAGFSGRAPESSWPDYLAGYEAGRRRRAAAGLELG
jgi:hypothetical protein